MDTKTCTQCKTEKPLTEFRLTGRASNGKRYVASDCNDCHRASSQAYRQANLEAARERERSYGRRNAQQKRVAASKWYEENKERALANRRARYEADPELYRDRQHMRRAKLAGATEIEFIRRLAVYERDGGVCHVCKKHIALEDYHMDHVHPLKQGGQHTYANVKASHARCNLARRGQIFSPAP